MESTQINRVMQNILALHNEESVSQRAERPYDNPSQRLHNLTSEDRENMAVIEDVLHVLGSGLQVTVQVC